LKIKHQIKAKYPNDMPIGLQERYNIWFPNSVRFSNLD